MPTPSVPHFQAYHSTSGAANKAPSRHESSKIPITIGNETVEYSSIVLRDACACPACVHESTRQRLFSIADVPATIRAKSIEVDSASDTVSIKWENDAPGFIDEHTTQLSLDSLHRLNKTGSAPGSQKDSLESQFLWTLEPLNLPDYNYDVYMKDDRALNDLVIQLRTKGLAFVTGVPGTEEALATIATRIGPIKDTFYGYTWDGMFEWQHINLCLLANMVLQSERSLRR